MDPEGGKGAETRQVELADAFNRLDNVYGQLVETGERAARAEVRVELLTRQLTEAQPELDRMRGQVAEARQHQTGLSAPGRASERTTGHRACSARCRARLLRPNLRLADVCREYSSRLLQTPLEVPVLPRLLGVGAVSS